MLLSVPASPERPALSTALNKDIIAAIVWLDNKSKALLTIEPFDGTYRHSLLQAHMRVRRTPIARTILTSTMSLEKEPAGAFNKAQRLTNRYNVCGFEWLANGKADLCATRPSWVRCSPSHH
jgi:hypothetical protein